MSRPETATDVAQHLAALARDLDLTVQKLEQADRDATEKRAAHDLAFSRAFLAATGSVDARKHQAQIDTHDQRLAADVADTVVRHLRRKVDSLRIRIDVGRTYSAAIRSELELAGRMGES